MITFSFFPIFFRILLFPWYHEGTVKTTHTCTDKSDIIEIPVDIIHWFDGVSKVDFTEGESLELDFVGAEKKHYIMSSSKQILFLYARTAVDQRRSSEQRDTAATEVRTGKSANTAAMIEIFNF